MRLLPRTRRGTWLLAGTVWAGACAALWYLLPVVPRSVTRLPERSNLLGYGPDGATLLVARYIVPSLTGDQKTGCELLLLEADTANHVATLLNRCNGVVLLGHSRDCRSFVMIESHDATSHFVRLDLVDRTAKRLAIPSLDAMNLYEVARLTTWPPSYSASFTPRFGALSPDGRFLAYPSRSGYAIWDTINDEQVGLVAASAGNLVFAADGRSIACSVMTAEKQIAIRVFDLPTLNPKGTFQAPRDSEVRLIHLSDNGKIVAANFRLNNSTRRSGFYYGTVRPRISKDTGDIPAWVDNRQSATSPPSQGESEFEHDLRVWEVARGTVKLRMEGWIGASALSPDGTKLVVHLPREPLTSQLAWYDLVNCEQRLAVDLRTSWPVPLNQSPDGSKLIVGERQPMTRPGLIDRIAAYLGVSQFLPTSNDKLTGRIFDTATIKSAREVTADSTSLGCVGRSTEYRDGINVVWNPHGAELAAPTADDRLVMHLWDVPPPKPLAWFAAGVALIALPIAWLARWRVRKLRAFAAL